MRKAVLAMAATVAAGVLALAITALTTDTPRGFTLGVTTGGVAADLRAGAQACQAPIRIPDEHADFSAVTFAVGTFKRPGPPLEVTVTRVGERTPIARGRLAPGYGDLDVQRTQTVSVGHVGERAPLRVCVRNLGPGRAGLMGNSGVASRTTSATVRGTPVDTDLNLSFERSGPRSLASVIPAMFERAALFRTSWTGAWTYVVATLLVLVGVPLLLARALRAAADDEP